MSLLVHSWVILTVVLATALAVVVPVQALIRLVRRPAADPADVPSAEVPPAVERVAVHVPAPRTPLAQDPVPTH